MYKQILLKPRISEKAYAQSQTDNVYVFSVPQSANKMTVARAVTAQFNVVVISVRIAHLPPTPKRSIRNGGRKVNKGFQPGIKKAYVTLKEGEAIPIYAAEEEEKVRTEKLNKQLAKGKK